MKDGIETSGMDEDQIKEMILEAFENKLFDCIQHQEDNYFILEVPGGEVKVSFNFKQNKNGVMN